MSHDAWAAFSTTELARDCSISPANWFVNSPPWEYETYATRDPSNGWPHPDGAIEVAPTPTGASHLIAVEFKRTNEGIHGVLTGVGQAQAYVHKGFSAAVLVLPTTYDTLTSPGEYVTNVLAQSAPDAPIGVFTYDAPDLGATSPFAGKMRCYRSPRFDVSAVPRAPQQSGGIGRQRTQWAHVREGSTVPDPLFRYLQATRDVAASDRYVPTLLPELVAAVQRLSPGADPAFYLSNTSSERGRRPLADSAWQRFWFQFVMTPQTQRIWNDVDGVLVQDRSPTRLLQWDGSPTVFFARADSIKARVLSGVTSGAISAEEAWEQYAQKIRERAHQYREDVDSGAEAAGLIDADGRLTELGFRFVSACEKAGGANNPLPLAILRWALLTNGGYLALLHYIHSISDRMFRDDQLRFVEIPGVPPTRARSRFRSTEYRQVIYDELSNTLRVAGRSARRPGRQRPPLEGEFITMRKLGLVGSFRAGIGLEINWPAVHGALEPEFS